MALSPFSRLFNAIQISYQKKRQGRARIPLSLSSEAASRFARRNWPFYSKKISSSLT